MTLEPENFEPKKQDLRKFVLSLAVCIYALLFVVSVIVRVNTSSIEPTVTDNYSSDLFTDNSNSTFYDTSWIPSGYTQYDDTFAWRWGSSSETNCTYSSSSCWSMFIVTSTNCVGGVYGEISILDSSSIQIDYTNDTTGAVYQGDITKLTFDTFNEEAASARLSQLSCRNY